MTEKLKNPRLAAAAEALLEAANLEADSFAQTKLAQNLDNLKASLDAKINTLNQHVAGVKSKIGALKSLMEEECKAKTLERARGLVHLRSFNYCGKDGVLNQYTTQKNSSEIALYWNGSHWVMDIIFPRPHWKSLEETI